MSNLLVHLSSDFGNGLAGACNRGYELRASRLSPDPALVTCRSCRRTMEYRRDVALLDVELRHTWLVLGDWIMENGRPGEWPTWIGEPPAHVLDMAETLEKAGVILSRDAPDMPQTVLLAELERVAAAHAAGAIAALLRAASWALGNDVPLLQRVA